MNGSYLLDTNIVIELFNDNLEIKAWFNAAPEVFLPSVALGELYYGAAHSSQREANSARVDDLASQCTVLSIDSETAQHYGRIKGELRKQGRPIPENDIWIAACAFQYRLAVVTRDNHFGHIDHLRVEFL
jgi:tRNA(fMet)-specific endonuclease VapC